MVKVCKRVLLICFLFCLGGLIVFIFMHYKNYINENSDFFQVVVTVILAAITFIYVYYTYKLAKSSEKSTEATMKHVKIAQESNELGVRPVVVLRNIKEKRLINVLLYYIKWVPPDELKKSISEEKKEITKILFQEIIERLKEVKDIKEINEEIEKIRIYNNELTDENILISSSLFGSDLNLHSLNIEEEIEKIEKIIKEKLNQKNEEYKNINKINQKIKKYMKKGELEEIEELERKIIIEDDLEKKKELGKKLIKKLNRLYQRYIEKECKAYKEEKNKKECKSLIEKGLTSYEKIHQYLEKLLQEYYKGTKVLSHIDDIKEIYNLYIKLYEKLKLLSDLFNDNQDKSIEKEYFFENEKKVDLKRNEGIQRQIKELVEEINNLYLSIEKIINVRFLLKKEILPIVRFIFEFFDSINLKNIGKGPALNLKIAKISKNKAYLAKELKERYYVMTGINAGEDIDILVHFEGRIEKEELIKEVFEGYDKDKNVQKLIRKLEKEKEEVDDDNYIVLVYEDILKDRFITIHKEKGGEYSKTMEFYKLERNEKQ